MNEAILVELQFFVISILWGSLILIIYDGLRIIRIIIKHKQIVVALEDILYWLMCGILIFQMMYKHNHGIVRAFSILGMLMGMIFYHYLLSDIIVDNLSTLLKRIIRLIIKGLSILVKPFIWIKKLFNKTIGKIIRKYYKKLKKSVYNQIKLLKNKRISSKISLDDTNAGDGDLSDEKKKKKKKKK